MMTANKHRKTAADVSGIPTHKPLIKGSVELPDDAEYTIFDVGELSSTTVELIQAAYFDVDIGGQTNVSFRLKVDINGVLTAVGGTKGLSQSGTLDLERFDSADVAASSRVVVTAQGDKAAPGTPATVDYTVEHLAAE